MPISSIIPDDITMYIFSRLPVKSLMRFRCVCKGLCHLVLQPDFHKMHLANNNHGYIFAQHLQHFAFHCDEKFIEWKRLQIPPQIRFETIQVVANSNGLICLSSSLNQDIYLWNPLISHLKFLPRPLVPCNLSTNLVLDFGFVPQIQDYTLVKFLSKKAQSFSTMMEIYSLRVNSWKRIGADFEWEILSGCQNAMKDGIFHWIGRKEKGNCFMLSFDTTKEALVHIKLPECCDSENCLLNLMVMEGGVALFTQSSENDGFPLDIWVWKEGWSIQFSLTDKWVDFQFPLGILKWGELLLKDDDDRLVVYEPKSQKIKTILIGATKVSMFTFYRPSLSSVLFL